MRGDMMTDVCNVERMEVLDGKSSSVEILWFRRRGEREGRHTVQYLFLVHETGLPAYILHRCFVHECMDTQNSIA
jgi:hypothetical protein